MAAEVEGVVEGAWCVNFPACSSRHEGKPTGGAAGLRLEVMSSSLVGGLLKNIAGDLGLPNYIEKDVVVDGVVGVQDLIPLMSLRRVKRFCKVSEDRFYFVKAMVPDSISGRNSSNSST